MRSPSSPRLPPANVPCLTHPVDAAQLLRPRPSTCLGKPSRRWAIVTQHQLRYGLFVVPLQIDDLDSPGIRMQACRLTVG